MILWVRSTKLFQPINIWYPIITKHFIVTTYPYRPAGINSLSPGKFDSDLKCMIIKFVLLIDKIVLISMPQSHVDIMSTLVQVMAWYHLATSHYLSHHWPRFMPLYGNTRSYLNIVWWPLGIILCMSLAHERWRYIVTSSLIGWANTIFFITGHWELLLLS